MPLRNSLAVLPLLAACASVPMDGSPSPPEPGTPTPMPPAIVSTHRFARTVGPAPGETITLNPDIASAWSEWSSPVRGLSARFSFPGRCPRSLFASSALELRFTPGDLPEGVTDFNTYDIDRGVRLLLRNASTGEEVGIPALDSFDGPPVPPPPDLEPGANPSSPWYTSIRDGGTVRLRMAFPLALAWDRLAPGAWEVRIAASFKTRPGDPAGAWTGEFSTAALAVVLKDEPPVTVRYLVPTRLRFLPAEDADPTGAGSVGCRAEDHEAIEISRRRGFTFGVAVWRDGHKSQVCESPLPDLGTFDQRLPGASGPFSHDYDIEIFETGEPPRHLTTPNPRHPTYRTLWKRRFHVESAAEDVGRTEPDPRRR